MSEKDLIGVDLSNSSLRNANLSGRVLIGANLRGCDLRNADLSGANLNYADLSGADLTGAILCYSQLYETKFNGTILMNADLRRVDLSRVILSDSDLDGAVMDEVPYFTTADTPQKGYKLVNQSVFSYYRWPAQHVERQQVESQYMESQYMESRCPIILLHGMTGHALDYEELVPMITQTGRCVYSIDLPGHGESRSIDSHMPFDESNTFENVISELAECCAQLGGKEYTILGYSLGARLALHISAFLESHTTKQAPKALYLISADPGIQDTQQRATRIQTDRAWAGYLLENGYQKFHQRWVEQSVLTHLPDKRPERFQQLNERRALNDPEGIAWAFKVLSKGKMPALQSVIPTLTCRQIWFTGSKDTKFSSIAEKYVPKSAEHIQLEQCGHAPHLESPKQFFEQFTHAQKIIESTS